MSPTQKKRLTMVLLVLAGVGLAVTFALKALQKNIEFFLTPAQVQAGEFTPKQLYKIAGLVKTGSVITLENGVTRQFLVTDCINDVMIEYTGILPDLFREGQAIVAKGELLETKSMKATQVLAKHDENYVPNEAAETMMLAQASKCEGATEPVSY